MPKRSVQFFITPGGERMVVLPRDDYDILIGRGPRAEPDEDEVDRRAAQEILDRIASGEEPVYPAELIDRLINGEHPVKVYREWKKWSQKALAEKAGINPIYLSQIETGRRRGSADLRRALAAVLGVDEDLLDPRYPLIQLRLSLGLSIQELAETTGISSRRLGALERNRTVPWKDELNLLETAFGVKLDIETGPLTEGLTGMAAHPVTRIVLKPTLAGRARPAPRASGIPGFAEKPARKPRSR